MGIYISGVKGLPEQVQQNKEDIKTIQDEIEGIDFETIRALETQVGENTQDINNLEAAIGVQNQAINGLKDDVDALETKTQKITYNEDTGKTNIDSYTIINGDLDTDNVAVAGNGTFQNANGSGLHFQEGANDDILTIANNDGATRHSLQSDGSGNLTLDGNPVGGTTLYQHNIRIYNQVAGNYIIQAQITIIDENNTPYTSINELKTYLTAKGYTAYNKALMASGVYIDLSANNTGNILSIYFETPSVVISRYSPAGNNIQGFGIPTTSTVNDKVVQIA